MTPRDVFIKATIKYNGDLQAIDRLHSSGKLTMAQYIDACAEAYGVYSRAIEKIYDEGLWR